MTIEVQDKSVSKRIEVRRDMSYLLTLETTAWLTEKTPVDDYDTSDDFKDLDGC